MGVIYTSAICMCVSVHVSYGGDRELWGYLLCLQIQAASQTFCYIHKSCTLRKNASTFALLYVVVEILYDHRLEFKFVKGFVFI